MKNVLMDTIELSKGLMVDTASSANAMAMQALVTK